MLVDYVTGARPEVLPFAGQGWLFWKALRTAGSRSVAYEREAIEPAARTDTMTTNSRLPMEDGYAWDVEAVDALKAETASCA